MTFCLMLVLLLGTVKEEFYGAMLIYVCGVQGFSCAWLPLVYSYFFFLFMALGVTGFVLMGEVAAAVWIL